MLVGRRRLARLLDGWHRTGWRSPTGRTLRWTGRWARDAGVPRVMVSHESLAGLLGVSGLPARRARLADRLNARTADAYDPIVCTTGWAAAEFLRIGAPNLVRVPLGVDLDTFHPGRHDPAVRAALRRRRRGAAGALQPAVRRRSGRSWPSTRWPRCVAAGVPARLVVLGDGPRRPALAVRGPRGLPVHFAGFLPDQDGRGRAAGQRRRGDRARPGGDLRAGRRWRRWPAARRWWSTRRARCPR